MLEHTLRTYQSPTRLVQRLGAIRELGSEAYLLGIRRPLLVTDPGVASLAPMPPGQAALSGDVAARIVPHDEATLPLQTADGQIEMFASA